MPGSSNKASAGEKSPAKRIEKNYVHPEVASLTAEYTVHVEKSFTRNLGDYNSMHVKIGGTLPLNFTDQHLKDFKEAVGVLSDEIDNLLEEEILVLDEQKAKKKR